MRIFPLFFVFHPLSKKRKKKMREKKRKFISGTLADWARHTKASFMAVEWEPCISFQMYLDPPIFHLRPTTLPAPPDTPASTAAPLWGLTQHTALHLRPQQTHQTLLHSHSHWQGGLLEGQDRGGRAGPPCQSAIYSSPSHSGDCFSKSAFVGEDVYFSHSSLCTVHLTCTQFQMRPNYYYYYY